VRALQLPDNRASRFCRAVGRRCAAIHQRRPTWRGVRAFAAPTTLRTPACALPCPSFPFLPLPMHSMSRVHALRQSTSATNRCSPSGCLFHSSLFLFSTSIDLYRPRETSCYCSRLRRGGDRLRRIEMEREINWNCVA